MTGESGQRPAWDDERATELVGARVLIGMTYVSSTETKTEQMYGEIISANKQNGFEIRLEGQREGEIFWLPPDIEAFRKAPPGAYHLRATKEVVIDPDYTSVWTVNDPETKQ